MRVHHLRWGVGVRSAHGRNARRGREGVIRTPVGALRRTAGRLRRVTPVTPLTGRARPATAVAAAEVQQRAGVRRPARPCSIVASTSSAQPNGRAASSRQPAQVPRAGRHRPVRRSRSSRRRRRARRAPASGRRTGRRAAGRPAPSGVTANRPAASAAAHRSVSVVDQPEQPGRVAVGDERRGDGQTGPAAVRVGRRPQRHRRGAAGRAAGVRASAASSGVGERIGGVDLGARLGSDSRAPLCIGGSTRIGVSGGSPPASSSGRPAVEQVAGEVAAERRGAPARTPRPTGSASHGQRVAEQRGADQRAATAATSEAEQRQRG